MLKIGYTTVDARSRVAQQYPTLRPGKPLYRIVLEVKPCDVSKDKRNVWTKRQLECQVNSGLFERLLLM
ncbi:MAG: GIY-YIG nuclease family protein [Syntrophales bacterium]